MKGVLIAIDPAHARQVGIAIWRDGALIWLGQLPALPASTLADRVRDLVDRRLDSLGWGDTRAHPLPRPSDGGAMIIEWPQKYPNRRETHADVDKLRAAVEAIEAQFKNLSLVERVGPHQWKANVPKAIHHRRLLAANPLPPALSSPAPGTDALDAYGLGLWWLARRPP